MIDAPEPGVLPWIAEPARAILARHRGHALLLQGRAGDGVLDLALQIAALALCEDLAPGLGPCGRCVGCHLRRAGSHADLRLLLPEQMRLDLGWDNAADAGGDADEPRGKRKPSKEIRIDAVRDAIDWTQTSAARGRGKVLLLFPADAMNAVAANALLKTLEEPPAGVRVILVTEDAERLLPTLRSRCQRTRFDGPPTDAALAWLAGLAVAGAPVLLAAAGGQPLAARDLATDGFDAASWQALPRLVAAGRWSPPAGLSMTRLRELLQKLCHDAMAQAAGASPRYFPAEALPPPASWPRLADWAGSLARFARHDDHPYNAPLLTDSLLVEARSVWERPRSGR